MTDDFYYDTLYKVSPINQYVLYRDGREIMRGSETEIWRFLHSTHSFSVSHALRWEGYDIVAVQKQEET